MSSSNDMCGVCEKRVYPLEKITIDKKVFHKPCFRCFECKCTLGIGNFSPLNNKYYCTNHYRQLFKKQGNYDKGFGDDSHKEKWEK